MKITKGSHIGFALALGLLSVNALAAEGMHGHSDEHGAMTMRFRVRSKHWRSRLRPTNSELVLRGP